MTLLRRLQYSLLLFYPLFWLKWQLLVTVLQSRTSLNVMALIHVLLFVLTIAFFCGLFLIEKITWHEKWIRRLFSCNLLLCILFIFIYNYRLYERYHHGLGYVTLTLPISLFIFDIITSVAILIAVCRKFGSLNLFIIICFSFLLHQFLSITVFPFNYHSTDMLFAIEIAISNFLHHVSPYLATSKAIGVMPYFPIIWISYIPAYLIHCDPRIIGCILNALIFLLILGRFNKLPKLNQYILCLVVLNPHWFTQNDLYFQAFLLLLVTIILYLHKIRKSLQMVLIGIFAASYQFAWLILPFVTLTISRSIKNLLINISLILLVFCCIIALSINGDLHSFIYAAFFLHLKLNSGYNSELTFGISNIFYLITTQYWLAFIQLAGVLIFCLIGLFNWLNNKQCNVLQYSGICYLVFVATSCFIEQYMYFPVLLLIGLLS